MFKKLILGILLASSLLVSAPKAEAGLAIGAIAGNASGGRQIGFMFGVVLGGGAFISLIDIPGFGLISAGVIIGVGTLLDVDAALTEDELARAFRNRYVFISSQDSINKLTQRTKSKLTKFAENNLDKSYAYITASSAELAEDLVDSDLSQEQFDMIVKDFE